MRSDRRHEWRERRLSECGRWLSGGTPSKSNPEYWGGDVPWVGPKDLHARYVDDAEEHLTSLGASNGTRIVPENTVLIVVRSMALAKRLQISLTRRQVAFNQDIKAILPDADIDPRFLFYALWGHHDALHALVDEASHGTKRLRTDVLADYQLAVPSLDEQKRITRVLAALDDKIDNNRQLVAQLEETVATIFKARFVNFMGIEKFEERETERVPKGWKVGTLNDLGRFINGKAFTKEANGRGRPILRIRELNSGIDDSTQQSDIETGEDHMASAGDILFAWSGSLGVYRWSGPKSLINQHIFKVIPEGWPAWFVYGWIQEHMPEFQAIAQDKATTMGHIQRRHLAEAVVSIPDGEAIAAADDVVGWLDKHSRALVAEASTLRELRDSLLLKLISGEMRVLDTTDPEEVIGPAADQLVGAAR